MNAKKLMALGALMGCSSVAFAANDVTQLDIVIRDFQPNHPDFENFSEEAFSHLNEIFNYSYAGQPMSLNGFDADWYGATAYHATCGNMATKAGSMIGMDGKPFKANPVLPAYLQGTSTAAVLEYGECQNSSTPGITQRGYKQVLKDASGNPLVQGFVCAGNNTAWANPVYYTPGMVGQFLNFAPPDSTGEYDMYDGVEIVKLGELCDNRFFAQWYKDFPGINLRTNTTMDIPRDKASGYYIYDYNYNNGGYSPLDSINPTTGTWVGPKACNEGIQPNGKCEQFGPQSLSIFCPPYNYQYANTQTDYRKQNTYSLCQSWLKNGGPRNVTAASAAASASGTLGLQHLRNYAFTMMGYAKFKYKVANQIDKSGAIKPEVFEFAGDDDMWIFVDGVLVVDLGGTHLSAPGSVNILTLAQNNHGCHAGEPLSTYTNCDGATDAAGWADNTWHHLHFFYADRQTDGSNIYIRSSLAEVAPSRYGQPSVGNVTVKVDEEGNQVTGVLLNTKLADSTIAYINAAAANPAVAQPAMVVIRTVTNADGTTSVKTYGYYITSISGDVDKGANGILYQMTGELRDENGQVVQGGILGNDQMAFNFPYDKDIAADTDLRAAYEAASPGLWDQLLAWNEKLAFPIASSSGKNVVGYPDSPIDWAVVKFFGATDVKPLALDTAITRPDFNEQAEQLTQKAEENGGELPMNFTADLLLAPLPEVGPDGKLVGKNGNPLNLTDDDAKTFGSAGVGGALSNNTTAIVGGVAKTDASMCFADGTESCSSWSFAMQGPFRINVRVFDHLGHFVSQYQQVVTEDMLHAALSQQKAPEPQSSCHTPLYGQTGVFLATVKMYPVSQNGRALATGVYIYQVTVVQEEYYPCIKTSGQVQEGNVLYSRTSNVYTRGYRREKN
ncbi:MAG: fibro-slime domain-containing protein [Fibrobacter sp.]|nr:fibro-slime domain-containing protein [Fibrobacter sp.]